MQQWRAPIFEKLSSNEQLDLAVWHGPDFKNSKLVSAKNKVNVKTRSLISFKLTFNSTNGKVMMPFSPFLFFKLLFANPDVIISEGASNLANSIQGFVYAKLFRKKFIWWSLGKLKNRVYDIKRSRIDTLIQYIEKNSSAIIAYSSRGKEYFRSIGVPEERIIVAVNVVDTERILSREVDRKTHYEEFHQLYDFIVLFVGALTKEKSIDKLLRAQKFIEEKGLNIGLFIVGDGSYAAQLKDIANDLNLKKVTFWGNRVEDSYRFFSGSDLFVLPGLGGLAISEAMCYGLPVISSIGDGCEIDLVTERNGIIDEEMDPQTLANNIQTFFENKKRTEEFGRTSKYLIEEKYNTQNYIKRITDAIEL